MSYPQYGNDDKLLQQNNELVAALHDLRQFWFNNVTQTKCGAGQHNPMWQRIATILDAHGVNDIGGYIQNHPKYFCE